MRETPTAAMYEERIRLLEDEARRLRRRIPRCRGRTPAGYRCAAGAGHPGSHTHPRDVEP